MGELSRRLSRSRDRSNVVTALTDNSNVLDGHYPLNTLILNQRSDGRHVEALKMLACTVSGKVLGAAVDLPQCKSIRLLDASADIVLNHACFSA